MVNISHRVSIRSRDDRRVVRMIDKLAKHNGIQTIKVKLIEELHEAIEAIESNDEVDIIEELADVNILTEQYLALKMKRFEYDKMREFKIERTMKRLGVE